MKRFLAVLFLLPQLTFALSVDLTGQLLLSPNEQYFVTGNAVALFDAESGHEMSVFGADGKGYRWVAFSPDSKYLAAATIEGVVQVWRLDRQERVARYDHPGHLTGLEFANDELLISSTRSGEIMVWSIPDQQEVARTALDDKILGLAFSESQGSMFLLGKTAIWGMEPGESKAIQLLELTDDMSGLKVAGDTLLAFSDQHVLIYNLKSGRQSQRYEPDISYLDLASDGKSGALVKINKRYARFSVSENGIFIRNERVLGSVSGIALKENPGGLLVRTGGAPGRLLESPVIHGIDQESRIAWTLGERAADAAFTCQNVQFSADGHQLYAITERDDLDSVTAWDVQNATAPKLLYEAIAIPQDALFHEGNLYRREGDQLRIEALKDNDSKGTQSGDQRQRNPRLVVSNSGQHIAMVERSSTLETHHIRIWDRGNGQLLADRQMDVTYGAMNDAWFVWGDFERFDDEATRRLYLRPTLHAWQFSTGRVVQVPIPFDEQSPLSPPGVGHPGFALSFTNTGQLVVPTLAGNNYFFDLETEQFQGSMSLPLLGEVEFSANNQLVLQSARDPSTQTAPRETVLWDAQLKQLVTSLPGTLQSSAISESNIAGCTARGIELFALDGKPVSTLRMNPEGNWSVALPAQQRPPLQATQPQFAALTLEPSGRDEQPAKPPTLENTESIESTDSSVVKARLVIESGFRSKKETLNELYGYGEISPDGRLVLVGVPGDFRVFDANSARLLFRIDAEHAGFSPDSLELVVVRSHSVDFVDVKTGEETRHLKSCENGCGHIRAAYSPTGKYVGLMGQSTEVWRIGDDASTSEQVLQSYSDALIAFSDDEKFAAAAGRVVHLAEGNKITELPQQSSRFLGALKEKPENFLKYSGFSADGRYLITQTDNAVHVADLAADTFTELNLPSDIPFRNFVFDFESNRIIVGERQAHAVFTPDGEVLWGEQIDAADWPIEALPELSEEVLSHQVNRTHGLLLTEELAASDSQRRFYLKDLATGDVISELGGAQSFAAKNLLVTGRWLVSADDAALSIWDLQAGQEVERVTTEAGSTLQLLAVDNARQLKLGSLLWNPASASIEEQVTGTAPFYTEYDVSTRKSVVRDRNGKKVREVSGVIDGQLLYGGLLLPAVMEKPERSAGVNKASADGSAFIESESGRYQLKDGCVHLASGQKQLWCASEQPKQAMFFSNETYVALGINDSFKIYHTETGEALPDIVSLTGTNVAKLKVSPFAKWLYKRSREGDCVFDLVARTSWCTQEYDFRFVTANENWMVANHKTEDGTRVVLLNMATGEPLAEFSIDSTLLRQAAFTADGKHFFLPGLEAATYLYRAADGKKVATLVSFTNGDWAVVDEAGRFDASNGGDVAGMHWVMGRETVALSQLKSRYYEPGLLPKLLGLKDEPLRDVTTLDNVALYPAVEAVMDGTAIDVNVINRGGGIGRVAVWLNGKEVTANASPRSDPGAKAMKVQLDLTDHPVLIPGQKNEVEIRVYNGENYLSSRGLTLDFDAEASGDTVESVPPRMFGVIAGVSDYAGDALDLRYAGKDAVDVHRAISIAAARLFGEEQVSLTLLSTEGEGLSPTKQNIETAFKTIAEQARPGDVVLAYFAGHGVNQDGPEGDYYYLTRDATSGDINDPVVRDRVTVSSQEISTYMKDIPALKQLLVLDTCGSGRVVEKLTEVRNVPSSQVRALERLKDRAGTFVLAGSSADAVSYEASRFAQGLLTHALLTGFKGAALRDSEYADVSGLFNYAVDRVPRLAADIGGIQRPMLATPRGGGSFDIGRLTAEDKVNIPLSSPRPIVLRANFQDEIQFFDSLLLSKAVNTALRDISSQGASSPIVFVDAQEFPEAVRVAGRYQVNDGAVNVLVRLIEQNKVLASFELAGTASDIGQLSGELANRVTAELERVAED